MQNAHPNPLTAQPFSAERKPDYAACNSRILIDERLIMRTHLHQDCEGIDASIFSGDVLYNDEERAELKEYVERWMRAIAQHEAGAAEDEWRNKGSPINPADFTVSEYPLERTSGWAPRRYGIEVTHTPTGMSERGGDDRSEHRNKAIAYERLIVRLGAGSAPQGAEPNGDLA